jgi:sec-independent protein translocase protein TatC
VTEERERERERLPIVGHLKELRSRLIKVSIAVMVGAVVAFVYRTQLLDILQQPYVNVTDQGLIFTGPTEPFSIAMRIALFGGVMIASPVIFYQAWVFVIPALTKKERRWAIPIVAALVILFSLGVAFAYWSMERALEFLLGIQPGLDAFVSIDLYTRFTIRFLLVFGIAFQFPVFLFGAAAAGAVTSEQLAQGRRWAVLIIVTVGAVVTPTGDPITLLLLSVPLYIFYEITIWLVRFVLRK